MDLDIDARIAALTGSIKDSHNIVAVFPSLSGQIDWQIGADISGQLPDVQGRIEFGTEVSIASTKSNVPQITGRIEGGGAVAADLAAIGFFGEILIEHQVKIDGKLPAIDGKIEAAGGITGKLPTASVSAITMEERAVWSLSGTVPTVSSGFEATQAGNVAGIIPFFAVTMDGMGEVECSLSGIVPTLSGHITGGEYGNWTINGKFPAIGFIGEIVADMHWTMDATIPPLIGSGLIVAGGLIPLSGTDTVATSDGIIRHRRGYDNG